MDKEFAQADSVRSISASIKECLTGSTPLAGVAQVKA